MRKRRMLLMSIACALLLAGGTVFAQGQTGGIFVKVPGVPGTADAPGHADYVKAAGLVLLSGPDHSEFTIMKQFDKASPILARAQGEKTVYADVGWITGGGGNFGFLLKNARVDEAKQVEPSSFPHLIPQPEPGEKYQMVRFICEQVLFGPGEERPTTPVNGLLMRSGDTEVPLKGISVASSGQGACFPTGLLFASDQMPHHLLSEDQQAPPVMILGRGHGKENVILSMEGGIVADVTSPNAGILSAGANLQMGWLKPQSMGVGG
ncbi:MAG: hypothetical protein ACQER1_14455 [Armatimonadota bacterium]